MILFDKDMWAAYSLIMEYFHAGGICTIVLKTSLKICSRKCKHQLQKISISFPLLFSFFLFLSFSLFSTLSSSLFARFALQNLPCKKILSRDCRRQIWLPSNCLGKWPAPNFGWTHSPTWEVSQWTHKLMASERKKGTPIFTAKSHSVHTWLWVNSNYPPTYSPSLVFHVHRGDRFDPQPNCYANGGPPQALQTWQGSCTGFYSNENMI